MVWSKGCSGIRQYMKDKPTKWGYKLWVLADTNGYTCNVDVYTGASVEKSNNGLEFDVIMKLIDPFFNQGYKIFVDNFYTSPQLFNHLKTLKTYRCGTTVGNRKGHPKILQKTDT